MQAYIFIIGGGGRLAIVRFLRPLGGLACDTIKINGGPGHRFLDDGLRAVYRELQSLLCIPFAVV